jgi:magnesium transporter
MLEEAIQNLLEKVRELLESDAEDTLREILREQRTSDIAEVIELLDNEQGKKVIELMERPSAAEVLEKIDKATRHELIEVLEEGELAELICELDPDDAADILAELTAEESNEVLDTLTSAEAEKIKDLMTYSEDSAGGIMDPVLVSVSEEATVKEAINKIRNAEIDEDFYSVFVVNRLGQFLGDVRLRSLITCQENTKIKQLINPDSIYVNTDTDQEEVRNIFKKNDLIVVPVLDIENKLVGRITADRIIEVAEEEAAEDLFAMAGTDPAELTKISVFHAARVRLAWLLPCLIGTGVTALVMIIFKNKYNMMDLAVTYTTAVAFVPMIAAISGNAGLQTSAIVISGIATGDLAAIKLRQVLTREIRIAIVIALSCGVIGGGICGLIINSDIFSSNKAIASGNLDTDSGSSYSQDSGEESGGSEDYSAAGSHGGAKLPLINISLAFTAAMFAAIMVATTLGLFLPFAFRSIGIDPAIASGPLVTTANDSISVAIYLTLTMLLVV